MLRSSSDRCSGSSRIVVLSVRTVNLTRLGHGLISLTPKIGCHDANCAPHDLKLKMIDSEGRL